MVSFGKKLRECRESKSLSQSALAKEVGLHHSIIGRYERDEAKPTIDVIKKLAATLETTGGYLLGEDNSQDALKDPSMLHRLNELSSFPEEERKHILYALDAMLRDARTRQAYATAH